MYKYRYSEVIRRKIKAKRARRMKQFRQEFLTLLFLGIASFMILNFKTILNSKFGQFLAKFMSSNLAFLANLLFYVFIIGGLILILIIHWVGWDNIKFKFLRKKYRSKLVCKDYYKEFRGAQKIQMMGDKLNPDDVEQKDFRAGIQDDADALREGIDPWGTGALGPLGYKDGKLEGTFVINYQNGQLATEITYKGGKLHGPHREFYPDGTPHFERFYRDGMLDGVHRAWDEFGVLYFEIEYKDNLQDGIDRSYHKSGVIEFEDFYRNGKIVRRRTFDESGQVLFEHEFDYDEEE